MEDKNKECCCEETKESIEENQSKEDCCSN